MNVYSVVGITKFYGQRRLAGYSPWGHKEIDTTEQLRTVGIMENIGGQLMSRN